MAHQSPKKVSQTTIERILNSETDPRSGKSVTRAIVGAVGLVVLCGGGIYLYHLIENANTARANDASEIQQAGSPPVIPTVAERKNKQQTGGNFRTNHSDNVSASSKSQTNGITPIENKLNAYIDCLNRFADVQHAMATYFSWRKDGLAPPTCNEKRVRRGMPAVYPELLSDCQSLIAEAVEVSPEHPQLHQGGKRFLKLLGKSLPLMQRMNRYYGKKRYTEDDCFKGRVFHVQLMKLYSKLMAQYKFVRRTVQFQAQGSLQTCIDRTVNRPEKAALHSWAVLIQNLQSAMAQFYVENRNAHPDLAGISRIMAQLQDKMKAFESLPQEMTDTHDMELFEEFLSAAAAFQKQNAGRQPGENSLGIRIRNGQPVAVRTGSLAHVMDTFHNLIKRYNFWAKNNCIMLLPCNDDGTCPKW